MLIKRIGFSVLSYRILIYLYQNRLSDEHNIDLPISLYHLKFKLDIEHKISPKIITLFTHDYNHLVNSSLSATTAEIVLSCRFPERNVFMKT